MELAYKYKFVNMNILVAKHTLSVDYEYPHSSIHAVVSCPAGNIGGKIRLVTLRTILDTRSNFHTFRQEFECANRNAAFF